MDNGHISFEESFSLLSTYVSAHVDVMEKLKIFSLQFGKLFESKWITLLGFLEVNGLFYLKLSSPLKADFQNLQATLNLIYFLA